MWWFVLLIPNTMKYYNLILADFHLWRLTIKTPNKQSSFFYFNICGFSAERWSDITSQSNLLFYPWKEYIGIYNFELFNFENLRVRIWPSTFEGQLGSKSVCCLKAHTIIFYLTSIDTFYLEMFLRRSTAKSSIGTFSLSRTIFEIFDFKVFRVLTLTFDL